MLTCTYLFKQPQSQTKELHSLQESLTQHKLFIRFTHFFVLRFVKFHKNTEGSINALLVLVDPPVFTIKTVFLYQKDVFLQEIIQK